MDALNHAASRVLAAVRRQVLAHRYREKGAGLVEYALLVALIALVCIAAITFVGRSTCSNINDARLSAIGDAGQPQPDC